jgi:hypothetical protein
MLTRRALHAAVLSDRPADQPRARPHQQGNILIIFDTLFLVSECMHELRVEWYYHPTVADRRSARYKTELEVQFDD